MADVHEAMSQGSRPAGKEELDTSSKAAPRSSPAISKDHQQEHDRSDNESPDNEYTHQDEQTGEGAEGATSGLEDVEPEPMNDELDTPEGDDLPLEGEEMPEGEEGQDIQEQAKDADLPEGAELPEGEKLPEGEELPEGEGGEDVQDQAKDADVPATEGGTELENDEEANPEEAEEEGEPIDFTILKNAKVNKGGNLVDSDNKIVGRVREGILTHLVGKRADDNGDIWNDAGKIIGKAEPIPEDEKEGLSKEAAPFESFPDAVVDGDGKVTSDGQIVGSVVEGDIKVLQGKSVDADGDILDRAGNVIGKAERLEAEPEPEPEPEADRSILAGKRVNKAGNVVDGSGVIYGRVVEGDPKTMIGRMCDKKGDILNEMGDIIGKAEVVPEAEREGLKEGPFAELTGCTVTKDGKVITPGGDVVGRLTSGDPKVLFGRTVDEDGDVLDKNGNLLGKAERWEEEVVEKKKSPLSGRKVNREGNVFDEDGNLIAKLTTGELSICAGMEIDDDGDVINSKGTTIGHVSLLEDIAEPEESAEEKEKREQVEKDKKLAGQMSSCIEQCLEKVKPICNMITEV